MEPDAWDDIDLAPPEPDLIELESPHEGGDLGDHGREAEDLAPHHLIEFSDPGAPAGGSDVEESSLQWKPGCDVGSFVSRRRGHGQSDGQITCLQFMNHWCS